MKKKLLCGSFYESVFHYDIGSIEELVENLVKTWECQASHFNDFQQWTTIDHSDYNITVNGETKVPGKTAYEIGNYNALMLECPAYKKCKFD